MQLGARPQTNHFDGRQREVEGRGRQEKGFAFNASKTSTVFRNMGNFMLEDSNAQQKPNFNHEVALRNNNNKRGVTGDSIGEFMRQYAGKTDDNPSTTYKTPMNFDHSKPKSSFNMIGDSDPLKPRVDQSFNLDSLINKNDERLRFLEKFKALDSVDGPLEQTKEARLLATDHEGLPTSNENFQRPPALNASHQFDHLEDIISKYK